MLQGRRLVNRPHEEITEPLARQAIAGVGGELLGEVSRLKRCLAVAGTHGKTTTASMVAHALVECGRRPGYLVGGEVRSTGTNASWGQGDWVVVEADESDRSFLRLEPDVAVVTNVELDHHSTYRTLPEVEQAFAEFAFQIGNRSRRHVRAMFVNLERLAQIAFRPFLFTVLRQNRSHGSQHRRKFLTVFAYMFLLLRQNVLHLFFRLLAFATLTVCNRELSSN